MAVQFAEEVELQSISMTFQGGFVAKRVEVFSADKVLIETLYPQDSNSPQTFSIPACRTRSITMLFKEPSDLFGRLTIYNLSFS